MAASLTNESYALQACRALESWLRNSEYSDLVDHSPKAVLSSFPSTRTEVDGLREAFLKAVDRATEVEAGLQSGLGVLCCLVGEYDKAADCFQTALHASPRDALLWNRLGACRANGGRPADALAAYRGALQVSPGYVRCRYNLAVACVSLDAHQEALEHLVQVLELQSRQGQTESFSESVWTTLRVCARSLPKLRPLLPHIEEKNLEKIKEEMGKLQVE